MRISVSWAALQPARGEYSAGELARLDTLVDDLHAAGVRIILTVVRDAVVGVADVLVVASAGRLRAGPQPVLPDQAGPRWTTSATSGEFLARRYAGKVQALEAWNEPNLWTFLYPQRTADDPYFAARTYLRMLKAFHAGVERARTSVRVVAGATAPIGLNDVYRTSPQRFARFLQAGRRRPLLRRLLAPPVHAGRLPAHGAGPAAQRPHAGPSRSPTSALCCGSSPASRST